MASLAHGRNPQARPRSDAEHRQLRVDPLPGNSRSYRGGRRRFPDAPRPNFASRQSLQIAECLAHERRHGGGEPARGRRARGVRGEKGVMGCPNLSVSPRLPAFSLDASARVARAQGAARSIIATARSAATRRRVAELGLADQVVETNAAAAEGADLVIVAIPVGACGAVAAEIGPHLAPGAIVSDVGSVKGTVLRAMSPHLPAGVHFVPAHPVAGTEN